MNRYLNNVFTQVTQKSKVWCFVYWGGTTSLRVHVISDDSVKDQLVRIVILTARWRGSRGIMGRSETIKAFGGISVILG